MPRHSGSTIRKTLASNRTGIDKLQKLIKVGKDENTAKIVEEETIASAAEIAKSTNDKIEYMDSGATIGAFVSFCNSIIWRYNYNSNMQQKCEDDMDDIKHAVEFHPLVNAFRGFTIYRKLREIERERRRCKHENEVIQPIYEFFNSRQNLMSELEKLQRVCDSRKGTVSKFSYKIKGTVLQELGLAVEGQTHI